MTLLDLLCNSLLGLDLLSVLILNKSYLLFSSMSALYCVWKHFSILINWGTENNPPWSVTCHFKDTNWHVPHGQSSDSGEKVHDSLYYHLYNERSPLLSRLSWCLTHLESLSGHLIPTGALTCRLPLCHGCLMVSFLPFPYHSLVVGSFMMSFFF